ncbi:COX aromatic rich motif-containing protein [Aurantiacibacter spongiae]|uniref:Cytochrome ubiquinol oxidase subunit II n=1 Tax=Aurantiacibacter spongiae TaxID=2488860 RepID=A0A3N5CRL5_9SPHN|nr:COX aromatic rich motif-containing protein [Aurantiacibacter spongiae]RPF71783.1 cytochrome ubiquinol oxidase subunit II [Aurantiacibacter spongiae]
MNFARRLSCLLAIPLLLTGCSLAKDGILFPAGRVAAIQHDHLVRTTLLVMIVIVPVFVMLPVVLWRYRLTRRDSTYRPDWDFAWPLEVFIWGVPFVIVGLLSFSLWHTTHRLDPYERLDPAGRDPLRIEVVGLDWKFLFIYPDENIASVNELVLPEGREVAFTLTADGPMMSFVVPRLGSQIYAMAGMETQLHLLTDELGDFRGMNTQFNGRHFHEQKFVVRVRDDEGYRDWIAANRAGAPMTLAAYARLARPSTVARPLHFGAVAPNLFDRIVAKYRPAKNTAPMLHGDAPHPPELRPAAHDIPAGAMP